MLIPVILGVTLIIFIMLALTPGDPARQILGGEATEEQVEALREEMGLNDPLPVRYLRYIWDMLHGDLGTSYSSKQPVTKELLERFPTTLLLSILCTVVGAIIGIVFGIISAVKQYTIFDNVSRVLALAGISIPSFWLGLMLMLVFAVNLGWLPASGFYGPSYWILPSVAIATIPISTITRTTRSAMLEVIRQDYMRTARAKGLGEGAVILRHGLKNTLIPVITVIGIQLGRTLAGSIVVENIFSVPGLGSLIVNAIYARNYPIIQGAILFCALTFCLINLMVDILYAYIDPRIKSQYVRPKARKRAPAEAAAGAGKEG